MAAPLLDANEMILSMRRHTHTAFQCSGEVCVADQRSRRAHMTAWSERQQGPVRECCTGMPPLPPPPSPRLSSSRDSGASTADLFGGGGDKLGYKAIHLQDERKREEGSAQVRKIKEQTEKRWGGAKSEGEMYRHQHYFTHQ